MLFVTWTHTLFGRMRCIRRKHTVDPLLQPCLPLPRIQIPLVPISISLIEEEVFVSMDHKDLGQVEIRR